MYRVELRVRTRGVQVYNTSASAEFLTFRSLPHEQMQHLYARNFGIKWSAVCQSVFHPRVGELMGQAR